MRTEIPPPGRAMRFPEWARSIVDGVRAFLPDATAVRKGRRLVIIRHGDRAALLANDGSFWVTFTADDLNIKTTMCSLVDDRRDVGVESRKFDCRVLRREVHARVTSRRAESCDGLSFQTSPVARDPDVTVKPLRAKGLLAKIVAFPRFRLLTGRKSLIHNVLR
jgi:hypothetical protein